MAEPLPDHYAELGVEPDVDARAIKVAYFTLVRQFPPETHPERFRRIREAYEVLSDLARRAAYDEARARPPELEDPEAAALWQTARDARVAHDLEGELRALRRLVETRPNLDQAAEILGGRLLETGHGAEAAPLVRRLLERRPDDPRLLLWWSQALRQTDQLDEALEAVRRARDSGPKENPDFLAAVSDHLAALSRFDEARAELDLAERTRGAGRPFPPFVRRRAGWLVEEGRAGAAVAHLERAIAGWSDAEPVERRDAVAGLAGAATFLFGRGLWDEANRVLAAAHAAAPDASPGALPRHAVLAADELPAAVRAWIETQVETPRWLSRYYPRRWAEAVKLGIAGAVMVSFVALVSFSRDRPFDPGVWIFIAAMVALGCAALVHAGQMALRPRSPLRRGLVLHALHIVELEHDRVRITPLPALEGVAVRMPARRGKAFQVVFQRDGRPPRTLAVNTQDDANVVARAVAAQRERMLELLRQGVLHREDSWNLFPPDLLARSSLRARVGVTRPILAASVVAGVLGISIGVGLGAERAAQTAGDEAAWSQAVRAGTPAALEWYTRAWPEGAHVRDVPAERQRWLLGVRERLRLGGVGQPLLEAFDANVPEGRALPIVFEASYGGHRGLTPDVLSPDGLVPPAQESTWRFVSRFTQVLGAVIANAMGSRLLQPTSVGSSAPGKVWRLRLAFTSDGDELVAPSGPRRALALDITWVLEERADGDGPFVPIVDGRVKGPAELPVKSILWNSSLTYVAARTVYEAELDELATATGKAAARALGLRDGDPQ